MGELKKWGGLALIALGGFGVMIALSMLVDRKPMPGAVVALLSIAVLMVPGFVLVNAGEKHVSEEEGERRAEAAYGAAGALPTTARLELGRAVQDAAAQDLARLIVRLKEGALPAEPAHAGFACTNCRAEARSRTVALVQVTGLLIFRTMNTLSGSLCRRCVESHGAAFQKHNLQFGWWSPMAFVMNIGALLDNLRHMRAARLLPLAAPDAAPPALTVEAVARLRPLAGTLASLLADGADPREVYLRTAERVGVTPAQVVLFVAGLAVRRDG